MINLQIVSIHVVFRKLQNLGHHVINIQRKTVWRYRRSLRSTSMELEEKQRPHMQLFDTKEKDKKRQVP
jgi:hypothetical protein